MTSDRGTSADTDLQLDIPVTPKTHYDLNPHATEFLSHKTSISVTVANDTDQWDNNNSIPNNMTSVSEYTFSVNGGVHRDNPKVIYSPALESSSQTFGSPFQEEQLCVVNDANLVGTLEELLILDNASTGYHMLTTLDNYGAEVTNTQYNSGNATTEADVQSTDGNLSEYQLRHMLKSQLESLFSRENLSNDSYLQSQMDSDQYMPVTTVANLDQIRMLTNNLNLIVELLRESSFVQVDEKGEKVRPNHNRRIVILREIPGSTPIEEVQNLFSGENCPHFVSCEFAHNDNWYVTFASDLDAQAAYLYLREGVKTFQGKSILARIKANSLIPTYKPRTGSVKPFQPPQVMPAQMPTERMMSTHQPQQFTVSQPFPLVNHVSQYMNGQQAIPFFPPPTSHLLPSWHGHMMDPSIVLAMNGYHATNVKVNDNMTNNRNHPFNMNRINHWNQKFHGGPPIGRDRINSNESLPPRLQHQHERQHMNAMHNNNVHKPNSQISNHGAQFYHSRRGEMNSGSPWLGGHGNANNRTSYVSQNHHGLTHVGGTGSHQQYNYHQQQFDSNNNSSQSSGAVTNGAVVNGGTQMPPFGSDTSKRFAAGKSYKSRRRREEDDSRQNRPVPQQSRRDGTLAHLDHLMSAEKFDYEPTSFPPLPGAESNKSSRELFENKLSDVVKGKVKQQIKETPSKPVISQAIVVSLTSPGVTATAQTTVSATSKASLSASKDAIASVECSTSQDTVCVPLTPTLSKPSVGVAETPQSSLAGRNAKQVQTVPETQHNIDSPQQQQQISIELHVNSDDDIADALLAASSNKPSYAEMVQRAKVIEVSVNSVAESVDSENADTFTHPSSRALKEQGQQQYQLRSTSNRSSVNEYVGKNGRDSYDSRFDREHDNVLTKESESCRSEPREQRSNRRLKENRERRFGNREGVDEKRDGKETQMGCDVAKKALEK